MTTSATPAAAGPRPKYKRSIKNYMLDPRFQLKWTGYLLAVAVVGLYAFGVTYGLGKLIDRVVGFRVSAAQETSGIDLALHAESAYEHAVLAHGAPTGLFGREHERPRPEPESDVV